MSQGSSRGSVPQPFLGPRATRCPPLGETRSGTWLQCTHATLPVVPKRVVMSACGGCRAWSEGSLGIIRGNHGLLSQGTPEQGQQQPRVDDEAVPQADHKLALSTHCRAVRAAARGLGIQGSPKRMREKGSGKGHVRSEGGTEGGREHAPLHESRMTSKASQIPGHLPSKSR